MRTFKRAGDKVDEDYIVGFFGVSGSGDYNWSPLYGRYRYTDSPADKDLFKKILSLGSLGAASGAVVGVLDVLAFSQPPNLASAVGRVLSYTNPFVGMAATYCTVAHFAAKFRQKDDPLAHFCGGAGAGTIVGAWRGSVLKGFHAAVLFGIVAASTSYYRTLGLPVFPVPVARELGSHRGVNVDRSWMKDDLPRGWTANPAEA